MDVQRELKKQYKALRIADKLEDDELKQLVAGQIMGNIAVLFVQAALECSLNTQHKKQEEART